MYDTAVQLIASELIAIDWRYLESQQIDLAFDNFISRLNSIIDLYAPEKTITIHPKFIIREDWMTRGLMTSSKKCHKL